MGAPDTNAVMRSICVVLHEFMLESAKRRSSAHTIVIDPRFEVFNDDYKLTDQGGKRAKSNSVYHQQRRSNPNVRMFQGSQRASVGRVINMKIDVPSVKDIHDLMKNIYVGGQMSEDTLIMCLIYVRRLIQAGVELKQSNWKPIILITLVLASKVWDDLSMWNADFSIICPKFTLKRINQLELKFLEILEYNIIVGASLYAKLYFQLRGLSRVLGIENEGPAMPLNIPGAQKLEVVSEEYDKSLKEKSKSRRRRNHTIGGFESRQYMEKLHKKGYEYQHEHEPSASIEELMVEESLLMHHQEYGREPPRGHKSEKRTKEVHFR